MTRPQAHHSLRQLAESHGIQTEYLNVARQCCPASPETLRALLAVLGVPAGNEREIQESLRREANRAWERGLDPVTVAWDGTASSVIVRLPKELENRPVRVRLRLENGPSRQRDYRASRLATVRRANLAGKEYAAKRIALPKRLPSGYHSLEIEAGGARFRSLLISSPTRAYTTAPEERIWGIFLPIYAMRSERGWGAGDFSDMRQTVEHVARCGGRVVSTLPLLPAFLDKPCEPSPYSAISRLLWNEFYLDLTRVPEFTANPAVRKQCESKSFQGKLGKLRSSDLIDYRGQMALKRQVLERMCESFFKKTSPRRRQFEQFVRKHPHLEDYAEFRAVHERLGKSWWVWPERLREGEIRARDYREPVKRYHLYAQWLAHEQMTEIARLADRKGLKFYLDLPLGVHADGYDVWRQRPSFALGASGGAPPDSVFTKGQDWGFPPLNPRGLQEDGYRYVLDYLRFHMRHTGLLRIDHVMGLHRLYWVPHGFPASHGAYVRYPAQEWYAMLSIESHRHETMIVGENLGTVPPEVNQSMARHRLLQTFVVQYEQQPNPAQAFRPPPVLSVASLNTHDMPPFAAFWKGLDLEDRQQLGLLKRATLRRESSARAKLNRALTRFLQRKRRLRKGPADLPAVLRAALVHLSASRAKIALLNAEDLWLETLPQNVPGTSSERPNWRRKARFTVQEIFDHPDVRPALRAVEAARGRTREK